MGSITADVEGLVELCEENSLAAVLQFRSPDGPRAATCQFNSVLDRFVAVGEGRWEMEINCISMAVPAPFGTVAALELDSPAEILTDLVVELEREGGTGVLAWFEPERERFDDLKVQLRVGPPPAQLRAFSVPLERFGTPAPALVETFAGLVADTPDEGGDGECFSGHTTSVRCDRSDMAPYLQICVDCSQDGGAINWSARQRWRGVYVNPWGGLGFSDITAVELGVDRVALARHVINLLIETTGPDTYAAVFTRSERFADSLTTWPPVRQEQLRNGVPYPYPIQILPVGLVDQLPTSPDWHHQPLDDGRVLVQPADLESWFGPIQQLPHLHDAAVAHYQALLLPGPH